MVPASMRRTFGAGRARISGHLGQRKLRRRHGRRPPVGLTDRLVAEVTEAISGDPVGIEPDEYWGVAVPCNLELLHLITRQNYVGVSLPDRTTIAGWKSRYLAVWDRTIDGSEPGPEYTPPLRPVGASPRS